MSSVDNRVVEMQFDNKEFEEGVKTTQKSLGELDGTINNLGKGASGGVLTNALSGIGDAVSDVADRFSYFETFVSGIFLRLGAIVADYGVQLTKSLTLDQVSEGWSKYEAIVKNTASIQNQAAYQNYDNDDAAKVIDELMWFADATSYSSDAMMSALNAMLGGGVDLYDAVEVIMGLANSFSYMGATATEMDGAFSMISKSMGEGAHMGAAVANSLTSVYHVLGEEIKTMFMETAAEMGILEDRGDGLYVYLKETSKGISEVEVSVGTFKDTLSEGWLESDVLVETYSNSFGNYANGVYALADAWNNMDSDGSKVTETMREFAEANGIAEGSILTASQAMEMYDNEVLKNGGTIDEYGRKVFAAAMEAKSFSEVLDALRDASSTQWAIIFQSIFGKYNDAKVLFTELGDYLSSVFVGPIASIADAFEKWTVLAEGGRDTLIQAFKNVAAAAESIVKPVTSAFRTVFGSISEERLQKVVIAFESFTSKLKLSDETVAGLTSVFEALFKIVKLNAQIFGGLISIVLKFVEAIRPIGSMVFTVIGYIADVISKAVDLVDQLGIIDNFVTQIGYAFSGLKTGINDFFTAFTTGTTVAEDLADAFGEDVSLVEALGAVCGDIWGYLKDFADEIENKVSPSLDELKPKIDGASASLKEFGTALSTGMQTAYKEAGGGLKGGIAAIFDGISSLLGGVVLAIIKIVDKDFDPATSKFVAKMNEMQEAISDFIKNFSLDKVGEKVGSFVKSTSEALSRFTSAIKKSTGDLTSSTNEQLTGLDYYREKIQGTDLGFFGKLIEVLSELAKIIRTLSFSKLLSSLGNLNNSLTKVLKGGLFDNLISKLNEFKKIKIKAVLATAISLLLLANACAKLAALDPTSIATAGSVLVGLATALGILTKAIGKMDMGGKSNKSMATIGLTMIEMSAALLIMASAVKIITKAAENENFAAAMQWFMVLIASMMLLVAVLNRCQSSLTGAKDVGVMFLKLASGLLIMAKAIAMLVEVISTDGESAQKAILALGAMMLELVLVLGAIALIQKYIGATNMAGIAGFFVAASAAMLIMSAALGIIAMIPEDRLQQAEKVIMAVLAMFAVFALIGKLVGGNTMMKIAASLLIISVSLIAFAAAIFLLGSIPWETAGAGLMYMVGILLIVAGFLALVGTLGTAALPGLLGIAAVILAIAIAIGIVGAAIIAFATAMQILATIEDIGSVIQNLCLGIAASSGEIQAAIVAVIGATCAALVESWSLILETLLSLLKITLEFLINLVKDVFPKLFELGVQLLTQLWNGISSVVSTFWGHIKDFCNNLIDKIKSFFGINSPSTVFADIGKNLILGLIQGIKDNLTNAVNSVKNLGSKVLSGIKKVLGINSPSTEFASIGEYCDLGLANGLSDYANVSEDAASNLGEGVLGSLTDSLSGISDIDLSSLDITTSVTPVLDLSEIQNETDLSSLVDTASINGNVSSVSSMQVDTTSSSLDALTAALNQLKEDFNSWKEADASLAYGLPDKMIEALAGTGVYMDTTKVGKMVTTYQANVAKTSRYSGR